MNQAADHTHRPAQPGSPVSGQNAAYDALESMPIGCCVLDLDLKICYWNSCLEQWTGLSSAEVLGLDASARFPLLAEKRYRNRIDDVARSGSPAVFSSVFTPQIFPAQGHFADMVQQCSITRFNEGPNKRLLCSITDVTEQSKRIDSYKHLLTQNKQQQEELQRVNQRLEQNNTYLQDFAHIVSHDLKSPLRNVNNLVSWIIEDLDDEVNEDVKLYIEKLKHSVGGMSRLIESLLSYARAGREEGTIQTFDLKRSCQDVIALLDIPQNMQIHLDVNDLQSLSSELLFQQVMSNLISNAIKYNDKEQGDIEVQCRKQADGSIRCSVRDNGIGIEERYHQKIFQIFQRAHQDKDIDSSGIGLALVKKIVEQCDGIIELTSSPGDGTHISFTWPTDVENTATESP